MAATTEAQCPASKNEGVAIVNIQHLQNIHILMRSAGRWSSITDIYDLTWLIIPYITHPLSFVNTCFPPMGFFSSTPSFNAATGIKSLAGKVILVTGG